MRLTDNFALQLPEGTDPLSPTPFNENFAVVDEALGIRAKMASGSWVGQTACDAPESYTVYTYSSGTAKKVAGSLGAPNSSSRDIVIELDFEPKQVEITGYMEADVSWSGYRQSGGSSYQTYAAFTHTGKEYLSFRQVIDKDRPVGHAEVSARFPAVESNYPQSGYYTQSMDWACSGPYTYLYIGAFQTSTSLPAPEPCRIPALVEFGTTEDGTYTVTIKGANTDYGTENYADIEGMTYNWVAIG